MSLVVQLFSVGGVVLLENCKNNSEPRWELNPRPRDYDSTELLHGHWGSRPAEHSSMVLEARGYACSLQLILILDEIGAMYVLLIVKGKVTLFDLACKYTC